MRSSRLAIAAVTAGSALLGWSTVGVTAIAGNLSNATTPSQRVQPQVPAPDPRVDLDLDVPRPHHGGPGGHRGV
jgi:hypothetical protein